MSEPFKSSHLRVYPDPILEQPTQEVTPEIMERITMGFLSDVVLKCEQVKGYALAAPQIGIPYRFFVMRSHKDIGEVDCLWANPRIVVASPETIYGQEGCLSLPAWGSNSKHTHIQTRLSRPAAVEIAYDSENGPKTRMCTGLLARVVQHEIDHLDGVLFYTRLSSIDRAKVEPGLRALRTKMRPVLAEQAPSRTESDGQDDSVSNVGTHDTEVVKCINVGTVSNT